VAKWINSVHKYVETYGFVKTITGRKRRLPFIWDAQRGVQNRARRQAVNTKIQGSSADLIKMAMIKLEDELEGTDIEMLMQIHDELIFAVPDDDEKIAQAMEMVQRNMENVVELFLPMVAEPSIAWRYGSAK
jgi:DNA polymerase-1